MVKQREEVDAGEFKGMQNMEEHERAKKWKIKEPPKGEHKYRKHQGQLEYIYIYINTSKTRGGC